MNVYFESKQYESTKLKLLVNKWILYNRIRLVIILGGLVISIWALNSYQAILKWKQYWATKNHENSSTNVKQHICNRRGFPAWAGQAVLGKQFCG